MNSIINPNEPGSYKFDRVIYAAPNLNYSNNPSLSQYIVFQTPTAGFVTRRVDLSKIAELDFSVKWPFKSTEIPINGLLRIPKGEGVFPLAIFVHGNHNPLENSTPGYLYLCDLLASQGIITATIDANFLNGSNQGENDGRAIIHLEHVKQFQLWNQQTGHPLTGKVDLSRVMIVGHSRGGEAVGHASLFNSLTSVQFDPQSPIILLDGSEGLGPYGFDLRAIVAIAPTDQQYVPVSGPTKVRDNYLILHGSRDGDVFSFPGYKTYDRSHSVDLINPTQPAQGFKSLLWIHGANHNYFNSVWEQESSNTIERDQQEQIAKVYISAMAQAVLYDKGEYFNLLRNYAFGVEAGWLPAINFVSQFQDADRLYIQHFEESETDIVISNPFVGSADIANIDTQKLSFDGKSPFDNLFEETQGLRLKWIGNNRFYRIQLISNILNIDRFDFLAFRIGQSIETANPVGKDQDFTIEVSDGNKSVTFLASSINRLIYPDRVNTVGTPFARTVLQTILIPLKQLQSKGINIKLLSEIKFTFNRVSSGVLYLDEIQLTK
jgi:Chlorophyllase